VVDDPLALLARSPEAAGRAGDPRDPIGELLLPLGERAVSPAEALAAVIGEVASGAAAAVTCVPMHFTSRERLRVRDALGAAGLRPLRLASPEAAAALARAAFRALPRRRLLVFGDATAVLLQVSGDDVEVIGAASGGDPAALATELFASRGLTLATVDEVLALGPADSLSRTLGRDVLALPPEAPALGAALLAASLSGDRTFGGLAIREALLRPVELTCGGEQVRVLERGTPLPAEKTLALTAPGELEALIVQGDRFLAQVRGENRLLVTLRLDADGVLDVSVDAGEVSLVVPRELSADATASTRIEGRAAPTRTTPGLFARLRRLIGA
jgi:hypothetical protein